MPMKNINPLKAAVQQVDIAAEMLGLEPGFCEILKIPKRSMVVAIPIKRDNGEIEVFTGVRVQHNDSRGPYKGGIRYHPDVYTDSQTMAWIMDTYSQIKGYMVPEVVTGKPIHLGGSEGRVADSLKSLGLWP
jgi:glutamate dehydrogenase/leucine dehydrogenase